VKKQRDLYRVIFSDGSRKGFRRVGSATDFAEVAVVELKLHPSAEVVRVNDQVTVAMFQAPR